MTTTLIVNAQTVGNGGTGPAQITKTSLQAATTAFCVSVQLTNGALAGNLNEALRCYTTTTPFAPTAAASTACKQLSRQAIAFDVRPAIDPSGIIIYTTPLLPRMGDNHYFWIEDGSLRTAATLSVNLVEVP